MRRLGIVTATLCFMGWGALWAEEAPAPSAAPAATAVPDALPAATTAPAQNDLIDTLVSKGRFNTFVVMFRAAGLVETLKQTGPYTIFAPTDPVIAKLGAQKIDGLMTHPAELKTLLLRHVVAGTMHLDAIRKSKSLKTLGGASLAVRDGKTVSVGGARVVEPNIDAANGTIQAVDALLSPETPAAAPAK